MSWEKLAQNRIDEAIAAGEFEDLPGRGQPLDLAEYFSQPPGERAGAHLLKNANVLPPELELLKAIVALERKLEQSTDPDEQRRLRAELQEQRVAFALALERRGRREPSGE